MSLEAPALEESPILFGEDRTEGIVAVEPVGDSTMRVFIRSPRGIESQDEVFEPFLLVEERELMDGFKGKWDVESLSGTNAYRYMVRLSSWSDC
jgi:hypothetical protein